MLGPLLSALAVSLPLAAQPVADDASRLVLRNQRVTLALGKPEKGAIVSLVDNATRTEFVAPQAGPSLFGLTFSPRQDPPGKRFQVWSAQAADFTSTLERTGRRQTAVLEYDRFGDLAAHVRCTATVAEGDPLVRWHLAATFPADMVLEEVYFPLVVLRAPLGDPSADDAAVLGLTKGGVYRAPAEWKEGTAVIGGQPSNLAAQFGCYYGRPAGFYTAAYDGRGYPKGLSWRRTKEGLQGVWGRYCFAASPFDLDFDVVQTTFTGDPGTAPDWRDAADLYKTWALTQPWCARTYARRDDIPAFMKAGPAMVRFGRNWLDEPDLVRGWLTDYWRKHFPEAPLITAYWGWEKVGSWVTPDYFPVHPSDEQFKALVAWSRKLGCHAFPWPSGYHWTLTYGKRPTGTFTWDDRQRFDEIAKAHAIVTREGKIYSGERSWLQGGSTSCLCPGDPWTIDWWNQQVCAPLAQRGSELIQVDQVVGGSFPPCYSTAHPHPSGSGLWMTEVFTRQLQTMLAACRKIEPNSVVCFEEPNEQFIHLVGIQDYRDLESPAELASIFNYVYHEFLPTFQSNPRAGDVAGVAYCLVNGEIPHMVPSTSFTDEPAPTNGGFERGAGEAYLAWDKVGGWQGQVWTGLARRDTTGKHSGAASLCLENPGETDTVQVSQNVPVAAGSLVAGRQYRLSAWLKTGHMAKPNAINFSPLTNDLKSPGGGNRIAFPPAGEGWVHGVGDFTVPEGTGDFLRIMIHVEGPAKAWVDDVTIEELRADGTATPLILSGLPPEHRLMQRWVALYHGEGRPYLEFGRMLHPPKLDAATITYRDRPLPAVVHNAYRAPDGSEAVILANATNSAQPVTLHWAGREQALTLQAGDAVLVKAAR